MKVLILGGAGFIGSVLCEYLKSRGDEVTVYDNLLYEKGTKIDAGCNFIHADVTNINDLLPAIDCHEAIVNLAAISNDPASDLAPSLTWEINYRANETIANLCRSTDKRVVYASSCSVYGFSSRGIFNELDKPNPVSLYARTKMLSEKFYLDSDVNGIILRLATVYGYSKKPRFDLVVNTMIGNSFFEKKIVVNGGEQWRPVVHVRDVASAIYLALHIKSPKHRVFNVGSNDQNFKISQLGVKIAEYLPKVEFVQLYDNVDKRSYLVDFSRIKSELKFKCRFTIKDAISELYKSFENGEIQDLGDDEYFRVKYLRNHINRPNYRKRVMIERLVL